MRDAVRCPTCRRLTPWNGNPLRPFCCERCKLQDLGNWASERYVIPGPAAEAAREPSDADDDDTEPR
jgi:endogenous inhibitor of DNA gyrase (YacG/DUF329 family)